MALNPSSVTSLIAGNHTTRVRVGEGNKDNRLIFF
jgi:hypothetical protein